MIYACFRVVPFGRRRHFIGHVYAKSTTGAREQAYRQFRVRPGHAIVLRRDGGRRPFYGVRGAYLHVTSRFL